MKGMRKKQLNFMATERAKCSRHERMMCCTNADTTAFVLYNRGQAGVG